MRPHPASLRHSSAGGPALVLVSTAALPESASVPGLAFRLRGQAPNFARSLTPSAVCLAHPAAVVCAAAHGHWTAANGRPCVGICVQRCRFCGWATLGPPAPPPPACANTARLPQPPCKNPRP